jgi:hypothetical protein
MICDLLQGNVIDVRELTNRVDELSGGATKFEREGKAASLDDDEREELMDLNTVLAELMGAGGDHEWRSAWYPLLLIADSHMGEYAKEYAEECCVMKQAENWPFNHIDWKAATEEFKTDYTSITIDGKEYLFR